MKKHIHTYGRKWYVMVAAYLLLDLTLKINTKS